MKGNRRAMSASMANRSIQRPISAQTGFKASFHQSLLTIVKQNNEYRNNHGVQTLNSLTGRTVRPQTAATYQGNKREFKTSENRGFNRSQSYSTISGLRSNKKTKAKKCKDIEYTAGINDAGNVIFEGVPKAVYAISVPENAFYQKASREANLYTVAEVNGVCTVYLP